MNLILVLVTGFSFLWIVRIIWPVGGLVFVDSKVLKETSEISQTTKLLDVRDATHFQECHVNGSINISIGRLPFVWGKELSPNDSVLILADSRYKSKKAARILKRRGFHQLYAVRDAFCA